MISSGRIKLGLLLLLLLINLIVTAISTNLCLHIFASPLPHPTHTNIAFFTKISTKPALVITPLPHPGFQTPPKPALGHQFLLIQSSRHASQVWFSLPIAVKS